MARTVGHFRPFTSPDTGVQGYKGEITMQSVRGQIALKPVSEKRTDNSPDFEILIDRPGHGWADFGMAWIKAPKGKKRYLSLLIQVDGQPDMNVAAFPPDEGEKDDRWVIVNGRPRGGKAGADAREALPADSIPY